MRATITRYEFDQLDCEYIRACERHRSQLIQVIQEYFLENVGNGFGDWNPEVDDENLFLYAYAKYTITSRSQAMTIARAYDDWQLWVYRGMIPDYLCSYYRNAMAQRIAVAA